jgi:cell division septation protein DedD
MFKVNIRNKWVPAIAFLALAVLLVSSAAQPTFAADSVLFDDQGTSYWSVYTGGNGNLSASIANETTTVLSGQSSLKGVISPGQHQTVGFYHRFNETQDFSAFNSICFWLYGSNSGAWVTFALLDSSNNNIAKLINDNFTGWYFFVLDLKNFEFRSSDSFTLSRVYLIEFAFSSPAPNQIYVDQLSLRTDVPQETSAPSPTASSTPTTAPTPSISPTSPTPHPSPSTTPTATPTPIPFTPSPTTTPIYTPTPSPSEEPTGEPLIIHVTNGTIPVTKGVVNIGSSSSPIENSGDAIFNDISTGGSYHLWIVVDDVTVYNNESFSIAGGNYFNINIGQEPESQISGSSSNLWEQVLLIGVIVAVIVVVVIAIAWQRRNKKVAPS